MFTGVILDFVQCNDLDALRGPMVIDSQIVSSCTMPMYETIDVRRFASSSA